MRVISLRTPRLTVIHCGSANALDQRVPMDPSTALDADNEAAFSVLLDDVARPSARFVEPGEGGGLADA